MIPAIVVASMLVLSLPSSTSAECAQRRLTIPPSLLLRADQVIE